jgi:dTDP-4-amino-4,6-dideoxygalactose transaminase
VKVPFVDLHAQYHNLRQDVRQAIDGVLERGDFILGQEVSSFEAEFAAYCETGYAVGTDTGTSALELTLRALDIGPGDEVITAANTFIATALAISYTGARPVLVDVDPLTYTLSVPGVAAAITPRTKAIMPVHLYGHPAAMAPILELAQRHGLAVVEDACQAHGARYCGRRVGGLGHAAAFSFYPAKNLGACGDSGMVVTNDPWLAERVRILRNYGQRQKYEHVQLGYNRRLDTLQAAILRQKLPHLDAWNASRRRIADRYRQHLHGQPLELPAVAGFAEPVFHLFVIRTSQRDSLRACLEERGIATGLHYPIPVHLQEAYYPLGYRQGQFPTTERYAGEILSLPMYPQLEDKAVDYVAEAISWYFASGPRS